MEQPNHACILYKATFDHSVSGVSWKSGDAEYKKVFKPIHLMSGDYLELTLDPAPANGEYFVHVVVGGKNEMKGIVSPVPHWKVDYKYSTFNNKWVEDVALHLPAYKREIDKFDYLLEEA